MYKTAKIRSALTAGLLALTALSMTPLTASAANPSRQLSTKAADGPSGYGVYIPHYHSPHGIYVGDSEHQKP